MAIIVGVVGLYIMTTNRHVATAFDSTTVSGYDQLVVDPIHARAGTLHLLMNLLNLVYIPVAVLAPVGNSDHSSL